MPNMDVVHCGNSPLIMKGKRCLSKERKETGEEDGGGGGTCVVFIVPFSEVLEGKTNFQVSRKQKQKLENSLGQTVGKPS